MQNHLTKETRSKSWTIDIFVCRLI